MTFNQELTDELNLILKFPQKSFDARIKDPPRCIT